MSGITAIAGVALESGMVCAQLRSCAVEEVGLVGEPMSDATGTSNSAMDTDICDWNSGT